MSNDTIVYLAHPISGDVETNIEDTLDVAREIHTSDTDAVPWTPYIETLQYLDDEVPEERELGIEKNTSFFERQYMDEVWLSGETISDGMEEEIKIASRYDIPVKCYDDLEDELEQVVTEHDLDLTYG